MASHNPLIQLLDSETPLTAANVTAAIGCVPFVRHQFHWLLEKISAQPASAGVETIMGYTGVKKLTPAREARLGEMARLIQTLSPSQIRAIPLP